MFLKIIIFLKFYKIKLKKEGVNCNYKYFSSYLNYTQNLVLGDNVHLGKGTDIDAAGGVTIGNGVIFGPEVCVYSRTHNFDSDDLSGLPFDNKIIVSAVEIKDYVWIGRRAIILPGVTIGKFAVIGAGAVVSKDVPDFAVAVGNPAKVVRYRNESNVNKLLLEDNPFVYTKLGHKKIFIEKINKK